MEELAQLSASLTAELTAFDLANRVYPAHIEKVAVTKQVDHESGYVDQHCDLLIALHVCP